MRRLAATVRLDVRLQARSRLYAIGLGVAVVLGVALRELLPEAWIGRGLVTYAVVAMGGTTFLFGASMLLLEKGERTLSALRTSPLTTRDYVLSKVLTLTAFALVEAAVVVALAGRGVPTSWPPLIAGMAVLGAANTLLGLALAAPFDAVTRFLLPTGSAVGMVLQLPFLSLVGVGPWWVWYLVPTQGPLLLLLGAFEPLAPWQWAWGVGMSAALLAGAGWLCARRFQAHVQLSEGP